MTTAASIPHGRPRSWSDGCAPSRRTSACSWTCPAGAGSACAVRSLAAERGELEQGALQADGHRLLLGTASGALELVEVQPPGGRPMAAADYLRGRGAAIRG